MVRNMAITVSFSNNQVRTWGYDGKFYINDEYLLKNLEDDFKDEELKDVLFASFAIMYEDGTIDSFALDDSVSSTRYKDIVRTHIEEK